MRGGRGFTLIEVVVVLGIVMILVSLTLPAIGGSIAQARLTRAMNTARQAAILVDQYCQVSKGVYPITSFSALTSTWYWPDALIASGVAANYREIDPNPVEDPEGVMKFRSSAVGWINYHLNKALCMNPEIMIPGRTIPVYGVPPQMHYADYPAYPVRQDMVHFPSDLGVLRTGWILWESQYRAWGDVDTPRPAPVAFCDTHVEALKWMDCVKGGEQYIENGIGGPVSATWYGHKGRDRRN
ncbi:MAG: type II secretion system protein [Phycisphaeraceae bacterium]|nr:MAG: type II secretion system protein [Phycisphaeraceae bacterium]